MSCSTKVKKRNNQAVEETVKGCQGSECLSLLKELRELHEDNLRRIDDEVGGDSAEIKLKAMQSWITDLEEQHALFLQTMVQLEREAVDRVSLLQEGLHRSSQAALAYRTKLDDYDNDFVDKSVSSARNQGLHQTQLQKLQSDITNLLELIRRVREENSWDATGLTFNEVTFEDVFGTEEMISGHTDGSVHGGPAINISVETTQPTHQNQDKDAVIADLNDEILRLHFDLDRFEDEKGREVSKVKEEIVLLKLGIKQKDEEIQRFLRRIHAFHNNIHNKLNEGSMEHRPRCGNAVDKLTHDELLTWSLADLDDHFQRSLEQEEEFTAELKHLKAEVEEGKAETEQLRKTVIDMKQTNKDMCKSLTAEVAEKHDEIVALRRTMRYLEEKCRETEMMACLKDDIIKELRKDLKAVGLKRVCCSPCHKNMVDSSQQEESVCNVPQNVNNSNKNIYNQHIQAHINNSDHQLEKVHTSVDEPQHSSPYQHNSTPKNSSTSCSEMKLYGDVNTDEAKQKSACDTSLCLDTNLSYAPDITDQLSAEEIYYEVCRRKSPPARDLQLPADGNCVSDPKRDTVHFENFASQEKNNVDIAEHLKNLLFISENTIKKQNENINGLQDTVKIYENDLNDLQIKTKQMEVELKDSKLKYIQQISDQDAVINDLQNLVRKSKTEVEMLKEKCEKYERSAEAVQEERENLKTEMEKLQNNLLSREKVAANQEEIINILQDSVNIAQKEQQDLQQKLKDSEAGKEKLLNALQEERKKADNLQEALILTKQQLEDLQGNKYEVSVNSGMSWGWSHSNRNGHVNKRTVHDV